MVALGYSQINLDQVEANVSFDLPPVENPLQTIDVETLTPKAYAGQEQFANFQESIYDGSKFYGGLGATQLYLMDYWTLRARSTQMFTENIYARGLIRRLINNEISTGLTLDCGPNAAILGQNEDSLADWNQDVEDRFNIWGKMPEICDFKRKNTFGGLQRIARMEALIGGDALVVQHISRLTGLPQIQIVRGDRIQNPIGGTPRMRNGHRLVHGVELDAEGRHVAFWIIQRDGTSKKIMAKGEKSGRMQAWLVYGTEKREDEVRGQPFLSLMLQTLKEIDRYKDATLRKAVINSMLAMFIKNEAGRMSSLPISGGAVTTQEFNGGTGSVSGQSQNSFSGMYPGMVIQRLEKGEEPVGFKTDVDVDFGAFEAAALHTVAWANNVPPEILTLAFSSNYSASQAAINEFKIYLNLVWSDFGEAFCTPVYKAWLIAEVAQGNIIAPGLFEATLDPRLYIILGAWTTVDWYGSVKPSTDSFKQAKGSELQVKHGWSTNTREARINTGTNFSQNVQRLQRENELLVKAMRPLAEFKQEFNVSPEDESLEETAADASDQILQALSEAGFEV